MRSSRRTAPSRRRTPALPALLAATTALLAGLSLPPPARADAPARLLVRGLASDAPARARHPLAAGDGRVPLLASLPPGRSAESLGMLPVAPGFGAVSLWPSEVENFEAGAPGLSLRAAPPRRPLLDVSAGWTRAAAYRAETGGDGSGVVVGIIDTGLDVAHPDFRDAEGKTRVAWLLQAGMPIGAHPELEERYGCGGEVLSPCAVYGAAEIDAALATPGRDDDPRDALGHGTHVASIAAGNGGLMSGGAPKYVGVAPGATLIIASSASADGGFFDADIANAARFIFERAEAMGMPAVVNLSVGGEFGPHDGTSEIERALASMVGDDKPGRALVVAAGNSGAVYGLEEEPELRLGSHTEARAFPSAETRVPLLVPAAPRRAQVFVWITFRPGDEVEVALEGPGGKIVGFVPPGEEAGHEDDDLLAAVFNRVVADHTLINPDTNSAVVAWDGRWGEDAPFAIVLRGRGDAQLWAVGQGDAAAGPTLGPLFERALRQGTINVPASHPDLLAVGCTINRVTWKPVSGPALELDAFGADRNPRPDGACYFSSAGPTPLGVFKPEISAPGGFVAAAMSADADPRVVGGGLFGSAGCPEGSPCFVVDETHAITSGSSMSAPHVAGAVALLFQRDPNLTQARVTEILQAGARRAEGPVPFDYQLGPGVLDVRGALAALAAEPAGPAPEPDPASSWFSLGSGYARPDPTWPVEGFVELRRPDGSLASGLAGTRLSLEVEGGLVVRPLQKVRHGTFSFAVAGRPGSTGTRMRVDVLYDGVSLGAQELPVGPDAWVAEGDVVGSSGGCACRAAGPATSETPGGRLALAALALGLGALRRRRSNSMRTSSSTPRATSTEGSHTSCGNLRSSAPARRGLAAPPSGPRAFG